MCPGKLVNPPGAWYKNLIQEAKLQKLHEQAEESPGWIDDIVIGLKLFWFESLWFKATLLLLAWCGIGVAFAMLSTQVCLLVLPVQPPARSHTAAVVLVVLQMHLRILPAPGLWNAAHEILDRALLCCDLNFDGGLRRAKTLSVRRRRGW